ncbi:MAG: hypothetical protein IAC51_02910 [bacterium]|uniref:Uncharacterized protein n=1 Tax=Candidatus Aphodosoma intestinipullorum TaxID=2840674 RepID=A0A940DIK8_9BACT|nr:hypothetical protein [Candidatus Aphodosoma intestinipullorum]
MEGGNIFVIILVITVAVIQIVAKNRKKAADMEGGQKQPADVLSDTFGDVVYVPENDPAEVVTTTDAASGAPDVVYAPEENTAVVCDGSVPTAAGAEAVNTDPAPHSGNEETVSAAHGECGIDLSDAAEARKAFIYSEIFNRKY